MVEMELLNELLRQQEKNRKSSVYTSVDFSFFQNLNVIS